MTRKVTQVTSLRKDYITQVNWRIRNVLDLCGNLLPNSCTIFVKSRQKLYLDLLIPKTRLQGYELEIVFVPTQQMGTTQPLQTTIGVRIVNFFGFSLYCDTANGYNTTPCKLTIHSPEDEYWSPKEVFVSRQKAAKQTLVVLHIYP